MERERIEAEQASEKERKAPKVRLNEKDLTHALKLRMGSSAGVMIKGEDIYFTGKHVLDIRRVLL